MVNSWVIRLGDGGEYAEICRAKGYVAIGWNELSDLTWLKNALETEGLEKLRKLYEKKWGKEQNDRQISIGCGQVYRFVREIKVDDYILSPTTKRTILIGIVVGDYYFEKKKDDCDYRQRRKIRWLKEILRDNMSKSLRNSLGGHVAVYKLTGHNEEIKALLEGKELIRPISRKFREKEKEEHRTGPPINFRGLVYAPINEQGVIFLFSKLSEDLNIQIEEIQQGFPDAIGKVKTNKGYVTRTIEFEFKSSNYDHLPEKCDILVCWEHDWTDCPTDIEVIELQKVVEALSRQKSAGKTETEVP